MGQKVRGIARVVLDTNVLVSALILKGRLNAIVDLWQQGRITPLLCKATFHELIAVFSYPKFDLKRSEIDSILKNEVLPFFEVVDPVADITGICRDPEDDKFLWCAISGSADFLVTGDKDLLDLKRHKRVRGISPSAFLGVFEAPK